MVVGNAPLKYYWIVHWLYLIFYWDGTKLKNVESWIKNVVFSRYLSLMYLDICGGYVFPEAEQRILKHFVF